MSNYLAIATVTATLYDILSQSAQEAVPGTRITMDRPSEMDLDRSGTPRINIYMYHATPNPALRNADLPTRRSDGSVTQSPQTALNLRYLFAFFGDETQYVPQRLMGKTVSVLNSRPILTRQEISAAIGELVAAGQEYMRESDLADQVEQVKLTPIIMDSDELSGFWSGLYQVPYSPSLIYQASVVLIESPETPRPTLPVRSPCIKVLPFLHPVIDRVVPQDQGLGIIVKETTLILQGRQLGGDVAHVSVVGLELAPSGVSDNEISVVLSGESLRAGAQGIQIIYNDWVGSNVAAFVLHPRVLSASYSPAIEGLDPAVTVETDVIIIEGQRVALLLYEKSSQSPASYTSTIVAAPGFGSTSSISIPVGRNVKTGATYLVRIQVDGAESPLTIDADSNSPTYNQYIEPTVEIP